MDDRPRERFLLTPGPDRGTFVLDVITEVIAELSVAACAPARA